ncbi:flagellar hook-basal body protein [Paenibacillus turpanensis]|uniref:flagellar hook-basal body protein n=1 Tax=Paenibacillus turpanensis TaxID=2689078 RepID=UPI00140C6B04|nr:flagellar hook-basal body protein [Paenibacillus turpanensis]
MNHSLITSKVSMNALQQKLDMIANNISNVNTNGFKRREATFQDVLTNVKAQPEGFMQPGRLTPRGLTVGWGAKLSQTQVDLSQGSIKPTDRPLDVAIEGDGLFEVVTDQVGTDGQPVIAYTRDGNFQFTGIPGDNQRMFLTTSQGYLVRGENDQPIAVPNGYQVEINETGRIMARDPLNPNAPSQKLGQLKLVRAVRPQLMISNGNNIYTIPDNVNRQDVVANYNANAPEADQYKISVRQYHLEESNVNLADEMTELMQVQRAYQLNARAITSSDTMMGLVNNLRG